MWLLTSYSPVGMDSALDSKLSFHRGLASLPFFRFWYFFFTLSFNSFVSLKFEARRSIRCCWWLVQLSHIIIPPLWSKIYGIWRKKLQRAKMTIWKFLKMLFIISRNVLIRFPWAKRQIPKTLNIYFSILIFTQQQISVVTGKYFHYCLEHL